MTASYHQTSTKQSSNDLPQTPHYSVRHNPIDDLTDSNSFRNVRECHPSSTVAPNLTEKEWRLFVV